MLVRTLDTADTPRLEELFEQQGFDYELPNVREMVAAQGLEDQGELVQAVLARPTVELYFLADQHWRNPAWRLAGLRKIHESMRLELHGKGFEDVHVFLPPEKARSFAQRLMNDFGWTQPLWTPLTRPTAPRG
jgi:hypothetical protein